MLRIDALSFVMLLVTAASPPVARAANDVWDGNGNVPPNNNWTFGPSWADNTTPGNSDTATFNIADTYTVSFSINNLDAIQALTVSSANVTFASTSSTARTLPVNSATGTQDVSVTGSSTRLTLGASPANAINLLIGDDLSVQNDAILIAQFGSDITASDFSATGLNGTIVLDSSSSKLTLTGAGINNFIGRSGNTGDLALQSGSTGNSIAGNLGIADSGVANSQGFMSVQGGATISLAGNLTMANRNVTGQVAILGIDATNSALTQTGSSTITIGAAANGAATIDIGVTTSGGTLTTGTGLFTVNATGTVTIGNSGNNNTGTLNANGDVLINSGVLRRNRGTFIVAPTHTMTVQNGGLFDVRGFYNADAAFIVTGTGSRWTNNSSLSIGATGTGALTISAGGSVSDTSGSVGVTALSNGTVTVTGTGSTWTNSGSLAVGSQGTGSLTISAHGTVSNTQGSVGSAAGSNGTVTVVGAGSTWTNSSNLDVGNQGTGSLTIELGGAVSSSGTGSHIGLAAGGNGTVTVADPGSTWTLNSDLVVGDSGAGRLNIEKGGAVSDPTAYLGDNTGGNGTVIVTGAGSSWTTTGSLVVGNFGTGTLMIEKGGTVSCGPLGLFIGNQPGNTSAATVTGTGSIFTTSSDVNVGFFGSGTLTIAAGGAVSNGGDAFIGIRTGSDGAVTVTGAGSTWTNSDQLTIGNQSNGSLSIQLGGAVSNTLADIGRSAGSNGVVTVSGTGSTWTNSSLNVGGNLNGPGGTGSLAVSSGGLVRVNGSTIVWANGTIDIQSGGTFNANDNFTIDAGVLTRASSASFNLAASKTMTIQNGGRASFTGGYTTAANAIYHVTGGRLETLSNDVVIGNGAQVNVDTGGLVSSARFLDIGTTGGDGSLVVTGSSSSANAAAPSLNFWASNGHFAKIAFSNNATGSFPGGISMAGGASAGTTATLTVNSGADLTVSNLFLDWFGNAATSAVVTVDGAGSSITQTSNSMLTVGQGAGGSASLVVRNNSLFTTGTGSIFVAPTGTVELNSGAVLDARGPVTMSGTFNFLGGTFHVDNYTGDLNNQGGTLAPGHSAGNTNISGTYKQQNLGTLQIEIGGTTPGTTFDTLHVGGATILSGTLNVSLIGGFTPSAGSTFEIVTGAGGITGVFTSAVLPALSGLMWQLNYQPTAISLFVAIPGDYNHNGTVDAADYVVWRKTLGQTGAGLAADGNANGTIDNSDYNVWRSHFGQTAGSGSGADATAAIPEPATLVLLMIAAVGWSLRRSKAA